MAGLLAISGGACRPLGSSGRSGSGPWREGPPSYLTQASAGVAEEGEPEEPPLPQDAPSAWRPPGIAFPWPADEYLSNGGDGAIQARAGADRRLAGVDVSDTVMKYETIDGETAVEASNRVELYAPRFAAVRKVESVVQNEQQELLSAAALSLRADVEADRLAAGTAVQPLPPHGQVGAKHAQTSRHEQNEGRVSGQAQLARTEGGLLPHQYGRRRQQGRFEQHERPLQVQAEATPVTWSHDKGVQILLDRQFATAESGDQRVQATYCIDVPNSPRLQVVKSVSTNSAAVGDTVDFTIYFDNVGDQSIRNVTLIDNLTARLEYVEGTARSSRDSSFSMERNEEDSLVLRWDFADPLPAGQGGVIRYQCRVR